MRVFLAIDLPVNIKDKIKKLEDMLSQYSRYIRLTPYDNLHITLKFLGEQNDFSINRIVELSKKTFNTYKIFDICLNKYGIFGGLEHPRILWIGAENSAFDRLSKQVNESLDVFRKHEKVSVCHLTIGRIKMIPKEYILDSLKICKNFIKENKLCFNVEAVHLYSSALSKQGAIYKKIETFKLKGEYNG